MTIRAGLVLAGLLAVLPAATAAPLVVSVGGTAEDPAYLPLHAADALGTFTAEGVEVVLRRARHPTAAMDALRGEDAAVAATTLDQAVRGGFARGTPVRILVAHTRAPALALLASRASPGRVTRLAELRGQRVGVPGPGTTADLVLRAVLRRERIEPWQLDIVSLPGAQLAARLGSGDLVAAVVEEPWAGRVLAAGTGVAILDARRPGDLAAVLGGPFHDIVSIARARDTDAGGRDAVALAGFVRAILRVQAWLAATPPVAVAARLPGELIGDPERFAGRLAAQQALYAPGGEATLDGIEASLRVLRAGSPWPLGLKVEPRDLREPELVTAARARLGAAPPAP